MVRAPEGACALAAGFGLETGAGGGAGGGAAGAGFTTTGAGAAGALGAALAAGLDAGLGGAGLAGAGLAFFGAGLAGFGAGLAAFLGAAPPLDAALAGADFFTTAAFFAAPFFGVGLLAMVAINGSINHRLTKNCAICRGLSLRPMAEPNLCQVMKVRLYVRFMKTD